MMRQKSWNQFKKTMAASTLAGAIAFTGCAVMPSVRAFADTTVLSVALHRTAKSLFE